ncbi:hypothetical protein A9Q81_02925 [Gammaproteobacteria bacterium 42_54_T18]|mgnify:CR=1 FL=1|nr:hypothetical protein A9Q81_02925 [Gammaproteobacteria bacterium 42_54_T18]
MKIRFLLISICLSLLSTMIFSSHSFAANVTSWGGNTKQSYATQLMGRWALVAIFERGQNISGTTPLSDYWIFKRNGFVDHNEMPKGLQRSYYSLSDRKLTIKDKKTRVKRYFTIKYIDQRRLILIHKKADQTLTYNLERY